MGYQGECGGGERETAYVHEGRESYDFFFLGSTALMRMRESAGKERVIHGTKGGIREGEGRLR